MKKKPKNSESCKINRVRNEKQSFLVCIFLIVIELLNFKLEVLISFDNEQALEDRLLSLRLFFDLTINMRFM